MPKKILDGKMIKFIAIDRKYRFTPYPAMAPEDSKLNTYITGQHIDPKDPSTSNNLTRKEIMGEEEIKPAGRKKLFPHVILFDDIVYIKHNIEYNCMLNDKGEPVNDKDYAEAYFIIAQKKLVAKSESVGTSRHKFYLDDKDAEAIIFVSKEDAIFEAKTLIHTKANVAEYKDLIKALNLSVKDFNVDYHTLNSTRMKGVLLRQAEKDPESIKFVFTEKGKEYVFLAKLVEKGIIKKKRDGYYDGQLFIALDADQFTNYSLKQENAELVSKWGNLLKSMEEKT